MDVCYNLFNYLSPMRYLLVISVSEWAKILWPGKEYLGDMVLVTGTTMVACY